MYATPSSNDGYTGVPSRMARAKSASTVHSPRRSAGISTGWATCFSPGWPGRTRRDGSALPIQIRWVGTS